MNCDWREKVALMWTMNWSHGAAGRREASGRLYRMYCGRAEHLALKKAVRVAANKFVAPPELHASIYRELHPHARVSPWWKWGMSAVSAVLVAALGVALWPTSEWPKDPMVARLVDQHVIASFQPESCRYPHSNMHVVKPWFQGKVPFTFSLPEIGGTQFTLIGGKLAYAQHAPGAELLYQVGQHKVSVFIFQAADGRERPPVKTHSLSFNSTSWQQGGLRFYMLTDSHDEADPLVGKFIEANKN